MKRPLPLLCLPLLLICTGQTTPQPTPELTTNQIQAFFKAIEEGRGGVENWSQLQPLANQHNILNQMSLESWSRMLNAAAKSGLRSRMALQTHPLLKQRPYLDELVHTLGHDSDLFTRFQVFGNMAKHFPDDPNTPKFGLLLLLDAWNSKWPDGINLHGNSPREQLQLEIRIQWEGPKLAMKNQESMGTFGAAGVTPERCAQLLSQSDKWDFDQNQQKWKLK